MDDSAGGLPSADLSRKQAINDTVLEKAQFSVATASCMGPWCLQRVKTRLLGQISLQLFFCDFHGLRLAGGRPSPFSFFEN